MLKLTTAVVLIAAFILSGFVLTRGDETIEVTKDEMRDGVLIHITSGPENPHRVLMALQMAVKMSEENPVAIYMDIEAVKVFIKSASDLEMAPFPSAFTQLKALNEKEIPIMVCPGCLEAAKISVDSLMNGVTVANKSIFFDFTGGRIITLDY